MIDLLFYPGIACILLVLVHVYFGAFVLKRGVLFIDLALAQWAALGYLAAHAFKIENHLMLHGAAFVAALFAALFLTFIKKIYQQTNLLEASIGVLYITASAISVGLIVSLGLESHLLDEMLAGHLLFVAPGELLVSAGLYGLILGFLIFFHQRFLSAAHWFWDLVFYASFAVVVASSVKLVGVLLVFSYLVFPVLCFAKFTSSIAKQIVWGWLLGILSSALGMLFSFVFDLPLSYAIIYCLAIFWILSLIVFMISSRSRKLLHEN